MTPTGPISISWTNGTLTGTLPDNLQATILAPNNQPLTTVRNTWSIRIP